jgi:regulator of nucleoside diphosphate kinase
MSIAKEHCYRKMSIIYPLGNLYRLRANTWWLMQRLDALFWHRYCDSRTLNEIFSIMNKKMFVTINDYQRIVGMIEIAAMRTKIPEAIERLLTNLKGAHMLPQENISGDIITMNSKARLTELCNGKEIEITVTYPQEADNLKKKISVFSTVGIALLGSRVGDIVS